MNNQRFTSVWDAIEDDPEEAENMKARSTLMTTLKNNIANTGMNPTEAAKALGSTDARISDLLQGKINMFELNELVKMAATARLR